MKKLNTKMPIETYENMKIFSVTAMPLENNMNMDMDYTMKFSKGFRMPKIKENFLEANLKNAAKGISKGGGLSYCYAFGDKTVFMVKFKRKPSSRMEVLTFVTTGREKK